MTVQELKEKIARNSEAWHQAGSDEERDRLHRENAALYAQLDGQTGSTSTFDAGTGRWSVSEPGKGSYQGTGAPQVRDLSDEVWTVQQAAADRAEAGLERAKVRASAALDEEEAGIGDTYRAAKNRVAAQNEVERKNAGEWASDAGLSTGAAGQLALAQSVAAQSDLAALEAQEARARDKVRRAKSEMERDYDFAVAEARAEGDYALAEALYNEAARFDEAQRRAWLDREDQYQDIYALAREEDRYQVDLQAEREAREYQRRVEELKRQLEAEARDYSREQDTLDRALAQQKLDLQREQAAFDRQRELAAEAQKWQQLRDAREKWEAAATPSAAQSEVRPEVQDTARALERMWRDYMG